MTALVEFAIAFWPAVVLLVLCGAAFIAGAVRAAADADRRDERLIAEIQAMRGDARPWPLSAPSHATSPSDERERNHGWR